MNSDLRVSTSLVNHAKVKKLMKRLGPYSFYSLISFWSYVAINNPSGDISKLDSDDIEIASNWNGEDGVFYDALCSIGFLNCEKESISIHNWVKHNPYAVGAEERSLDAKKKVFCRWALKKIPKNQHDSFKTWLYDIASIDTNSNTSSILVAYQQYTNSNTPEPYPEPEPEPEPSYIPEYVQLVEDYIKYVSETFGNKAPKATPSLKDKSLETIDKLVRLDKFTFKEVSEALRYSTQDDFWKDQILSLASLRKKSGNGLTKFQNLISSKEKVVTRKPKLSAKEEKVSSAASRIMAKINQSSGGHLIE